MNILCSMADDHALTKSEGMGYDKWLTDLIWGCHIGWSCGTLLNLCPRYSKSLSLKVFRLMVWAECLSLLLPFVPRLPQESGVTSLTLGSLSSPGHSFFLLRIVPSWTTIGVHLLSPCLDKYLHSSNVPLFSMGRVIFPSPFWTISVHVVVAHWWFHSCHTVIWLAGQLKVNWLLLVLQGKHNAFWLTLGHMVNC